MPRRPTFALLTWFAWGCACIHPEQAVAPPIGDELAPAALAPSLPGTARSEEELAQAAKLAEGAEVPPAACKLVVRAPRMYLAFAEGMGLGELDLSAKASSGALRALNRAVCALVLRGDATSLSDGERSLLARARTGARFEVNHVQLVAGERLDAKLRVTVQRGAEPAAEVLPAWEATLHESDDDAGYAMVSLSALAVP